MSDSSLRDAIFGILRFAKSQSARLRQICNKTWYRKISLSRGDRLVRALKYIVGQAPLRSISESYKRGAIKGQKALFCVYEELQRRGLEGAACVNPLVEEINSKFIFEHFVSIK